MQVRKRRLLALILAPTLCAGLLATELPGGSGHGHALAANPAVNLGCTGTLTVSPTNGTLSMAGAAVTVSLNASGLDKNTQVFLSIYDSAGRPAGLVPLQSAKIDGNGNFISTAQMPTGGVAGGSDQIVVADFGPHCASAPFTLQPIVQVSPSKGTMFTFTGAGFHSGSTVKIVFTDANNGQFPFDGPAASIYGGATGVAVPIPTGAAVGQGKLSFGDDQGGQMPGTIPFNFTGYPPTATPCAACPTATPTSTNTPGGPSSTPGTPGTPTNTTTPITSFPTLTATATGNTATPTNTPVPGSTSTSTPVKPNTPTNTPLVPPSNTPNLGFPTATRTPFRFAATATNTPVKGFPQPTATPIRRFFCATGTAIDGDFANGLNCWHTNAVKSVSVQTAAKGSHDRAARIAASGPTQLSTTFIASRAAGSVTFYYENQAKMARAQLTANGQVLVGRRLASTAAGKYVFTVLSIPGGVRAGTAVTVAFTAQQGSLLVRHVALSASPTGVAAGAKPAKKSAGKKK